MGGIGEAWNSFFCLFPPYLSSKQVDVWNFMIILYIYITVEIQGHPGI